MKIIFYNNQSKNNVINKELSPPLLEKNCVIKDDTFNIIYPILFVSVDINSIGNYCYIESLDRYYFIRDVSPIKTDLVKLELECDFLYTFKDVILQGYGTVKESENVNNYSSDYEVLDTMQEKSIIFPNEHFTNENHLYLTGAN